MTAIAYKNNHQRCQHPEVPLEGREQEHRGSGAAGSNLPKALLSDGEGWRLQGEDLGLDEQLAHPAIDDLPVLRPGVQDDHGSLVVVLPILELSSGVLRLRTSHISALR